MTILRTALASLVIIVAATAAAKDMWPPPAKYDSGPLINARFPEAIITHLSPEDLFGFIAQLGGDSETTATENGTRFAMRFPSLPSACGPADRAG